jgi:hypothetical protein
MPLAWNGKAAIAWVDRQCAFHLNQVATKAVAELRKRLDTPYPPASVPGQYPRRRTGNLRTSVMWKPGKSVGGHYAVALMYDAEGFYGNILVERLGRLGPADVLAEVARGYFGRRGVASA